jgi:hypothetical protein
VNLNARKTRNCIEPWRSVQFEAGGNITPCCSGTIKGYFGNLNTDYFERKDRGQSSDMFANEAYQELRRDLLTGELPGACKSCRSVHDEDIATDELRRRVINHLESQGTRTDGVDLTKEYAFSECGGNISNKCNFSCIYCSHSGTNGHTGYLATEMDRERFLCLIDFLCSKGLKIFNFCGIGELTTYPGWQDLCKEILHQHPQLRLRMISNFGKKLNDSELSTLARLDLIHVSCDTLDEETYAWLRKGGRLLVLLDNIRRLREKFTGDPSRDPKLAFNVTATDAITEKLETLFRFAADNNMFVHLSNLFVMEGSIASQTACVKKISDLDDSQMPHIREVLYDLPRRMKAQNPLTSVWEYKNLWKDIVEKADSVTFNTFVPLKSEPIYNAFGKAYPRGPNAYLRKIWLSFDDGFRGIYIRTGKRIRVEAAGGPWKVAYRAIWCRDRLDGNLDILPGPIEETIVSGGMTVSAAHGHGTYQHMLFQVVSYETVAGPPNDETTLEPYPPAGSRVPLLVREGFLAAEEEAVAERLVESQEPIIVWCAGLRTLQLLSNTRLGRANIKMIIDGNPSKKGQRFCGYTIHSPEDIDGFTGKIVLLHASSPEQVAMEIRRLGIANEILIL